MMETMAGGFAGKTLFVDLTRGETWATPQPLEEAPVFIGGGGFNAKLALELIPPRIEPLSPKNAIIIGAGPLVGTTLMSSPKTVLTTKGPLTGTILSTPAGHFGPTLKRAGFDQLVIKGRAPKPVYLSIENEKVQICPAATLWGKDLLQTTDELWQAHPHTTIACIGQAGENQVVFSNILINKEATWCRGGPGAVMGSKNLKAIVVRGSGKVRVAHQEKFDALAKKCYATYQTGPNLGDWRKLGVFIAWDSFLEIGAFGHDYYRSLYPKEEMTKTYGPEAYLKSIKKGSYACPSCPMACKQVIGIQKGEQAGFSIRSSCPFAGTESFGTRGEVGSMENVAKGIEMGNRYGIDNGTLLGMLDYLIDLYKNKKISIQDCRGFTPRVGFEAVREFMQLVVERKGLGEIAADGWHTLIDQIGGGNYQDAVVIKGMEPSADLRAYLSTESFGKLTGHRGAHANRALSITQVPGRSPDTLKRYGKRICVSDLSMDRVFSGPQGYSIPRLLKWVEDYNTMLTYLGLCNRAPISRVFDTETCAQLYDAATGINLKPEELLRAGERIWNLEKLLMYGKAFPERMICLRKDG
ncbi:MAG: hypothetical protein HY730_02395 [Candidatus Tectomicrobia bacterium]|uniref:Aldehyde ferredoxin oxidoreductase N-terminal domain-containing protein n=1 Tax=Tectimicrobiota bacterium TaxID=2528274 RepID=A0A933GKU7_UNCTE|nr:hypothetical protein [Candidatus Tectomicrobia bacterium]